MTPQISVIAPTYGEAENLTALTEAVDKTLIGGGYTYELLIANDDSGDDTEAVCVRLAQSFPIKLLSSTLRRGLSRAVVDGIKHARGDFIIVMDADLSHPPEEISKMVKFLATDDADFVVGSRYVVGGSIAADWHWLRHLNSWAATVPAKLLTPIKDPMSGFFAVRRSALPPLENLSPIGYKIGLEILVKGQYAKARVAEVPINFQDRIRGQSKLNIKEQFNYLRHLRRLYHYRWSKRMEILQFYCVGGAGFLIDISVYFILQSFGVPHLLARAVSFFPAVSSNWFLNRKMTFKTRAHDTHIKQWSKFCMASAFGFLFNWGTYALLTVQTEFFNRHLLLALFIGVIVGSVFNFVSADRLIFRNQR